MNELLGRVKQLKNGDADGDAAKKKSAGAASGQAH